MIMRHAHDDYAGRSPACHIEEARVRVRTSVSGLINQAVRLFAHAQPTLKRKERFEVVTFGAGGHFSKRNIDKTSALLAADHINGFARRR